VVESAGSSIGSFTLGLLIGSVVSVGISKLSTYYKTKSNISFLDAPSKTVEKSTTNDSNLYDEIQVAENLSTIKYSQNIAYGEVTNI